jgi:hypothetical protein
MQYVFIVHKTRIKITAGTRVCPVGFKLRVGCAVLGNVCVCDFGWKSALGRREYSLFHGQIIGVVLTFLNVR